jgi:hypothetical protein
VMIEVGRHNASDMRLEDGWEMLAAIRDAAGYRGAVPHWSTLWLQATPLMDKEVAEKLGCNRPKVQKWRFRSAFDPLTLERVRGLGPF